MEHATVLSCEILLRNMPNATILNLKMVATMSILFLEMVIVSETIRAGSRVGTGGGWECFLRASGTYASAVVPSL